MLVAALAPKSLASAGELAGGSITWMANAQAVKGLIAAAARRGGRRRGAARPGSCSRRLPVAVTDDADAAARWRPASSPMYGMLPNYQRVLAAGGISSPAEAAIVGTEDHVAAAITDLVGAGATDLWAARSPWATTAGRPASGPGPCCATSSPAEPPVPANDAGEDG